MKLDILAIGVHPDDIELSCAGTLINAGLQGKKTGVVDLTAGELGTRGTPEIRLQEAANAAKIMGLQVRQNLFLKDGFFRNDEQNAMQKITAAIRKFQPTIVLANALEDRHPDHGRAGKMIAECCYYSGLRKIETKDENGNQQNAWRPKQVLHFIQDRYYTPNLVVDISNVMEQKMKAILAYESQFYNPNSNEPNTYISSPMFMEGIKARSIQFGKSIGVDYGEGFTVVNPVGINDLSALVGGLS